MTVNSESQNEGHAIDLDKSVSVLRLVSLSLIVITPVLTPGMTSTISSIAIPQMKLSMEEASWFGSITSIAWPFGSIFTGLIIDKYGRRISLLSSTVPSIAGWFLLADANASLTQLYIGRALTGFALGACLLPSPIYLAECVTVNHTRIRSTIGTWTVFAMTIGGLLAYCFSVFLPYDRIALIAGLLSTLSLFLILTFVPESPPWLYRQGRIGDAEVAKQRLGIKQPTLRNRKVPASTTSDHDVTTSTAALVMEENSLENFARYLAQIRRRQVYKPLIITSAFLFFGEFSGVYCLQNYMLDVIERTPMDMDPYVLSVIGQVTQIFGCLFLTLVLPHSGVKSLSIASFVGIAAGFIVLACSLLFERSSPSGGTNIFSYIPIASIWTIMSAGQLGVFAIPYAVLGEMFPMEAKGFASFSLFADSVFSFIVLKIFPYMLAGYETLIFIVFGGICTCGAVFVAICLPETVGRTVEEIERNFEQPTRA